MRTSFVHVSSVLLVGVLAAGVNAWGGLFNRFNPSMLSNLGYGGGGYAKDIYQNQNSVRDYKNYHISIYRGG